jgi:hypothetical protein
MTTLTKLIPREREILQLVLAGQTNKGITAAYYVRKNIEFHLGYIHLHRDRPKNAPEGVIMENITQYRDRIWRISYFYSRMEKDFANWLGKILFHNSFQPS